MPNFREMILGLDEAKVLALPVHNIGEQILGDLFDSKNIVLMGRHNYMNQFKSATTPVRRAMMEGWTWLEREGAIAPDPETDGQIFITRRGHDLLNR